MLTINSVTFIKSYPGNSLLPRDSQLPEIAFIGRSNVGKSSLINDLCRKKIAKTSSTPGKTQLINFFLINKSLHFVDLPGYGYAKVSRQQKNIFSGLIESYLQSRSQLRVICFLLDIRRIPNEQDKLLNQWFKKLNDIRVIYILTKSDKLSKSQAQKQKISIAIELLVDQSEFILYSALKNSGRKELLNRLEIYCGH